MSNVLHDVSWVVPYRTEFLTKLFETLTWLGYPSFVMILLPLGYWLGMGEPGSQLHGAIGFWWGMIAGIAAAALFTSWRLWVFLNRPLPVLQADNPDTGGSVSM